MNNMTARDYAPIAVRFGVGLVFLLLGIDQFIHTAEWTGYLPEWFINLLPAWHTPEQFMIINGILDCTIGLLILIGIYTRIVAMFAVLHLFGVIISLGYNDVAIRDIGIMFATLAIALYGMDRWCLERRWRSV